MQTAVRIFGHPDFPSHKIRVKSPRLCDPNVKQYSGYLDTDDDKHFFFWFAVSWCQAITALIEFHFNIQVLRKSPKPVTGPASDVAQRRSEPQIVYEGFSSDPFSQALDVARRVVRIYYNFRVASQYTDAQAAYRSPYGVRAMQCDQ